MLASTVQAVVQKEIRDLKKSEGAQDSGETAQKIKQLQEHSEDLGEAKKQATRAVDARFKADIASGKPRRLALQKLKSRQRAATRRHAGQGDRAARRVQLDEQWHEEFDDPERGKPAA